MFNKVFQNRMCPTTQKLPSLLAKKIAIPFIANPEWLFFMYNYLLIT